MKAKDTVFSKKLSFNVRGSLITPDYPLVMGIVNVTPDSFYKGSRTQNNKDVLKRCETILREGGKIIDIGAYSSRPDGVDITLEEEKKRLTNVLGNIKKEFSEALLSVDTFRSEIAKMAVLDFGADIINDISGGNMDELMFETIAALKVPYILMHMKGTPQTMKIHNQYQDLISDLITYFANKVNELKLLGVADIIIDPGFGFAKNTSQNFQLLNNLDKFKFLDLPVLVGISRKSFIYKSLDTTPEYALTGTIAMNTVALLNGADIIRVHDVKEATDCIKLLRALKKTDITE